MNQDQGNYLSVVIPAYNEESTLAGVVAKVLALPGLLEVVIVDDCSTDGTAKIARELAETNSQVKFAPHAKNAGKTEALKTGLAQTRGAIVNRAGR